MEEMKPLRQTVADGDVEIKDGQATNSSEQSCGRFICSSSSSLFITATR